MGTPAPVTYSACLSAANPRIPSSISSVLGNSSLYNVTIDGTPHCQHGDTLVTWSQQGPTGETGATGATGIAGPAGMTGPSGPAGVVHDCDPANVYPGVNLAKCDLVNANLANADLTGATLTGANLAGADLAGATLIGANVKDAFLGSVDFSGALLLDVDLSSANLTGANLSGAFTSGALWKNTTCPDGTNSDSDGGTCDGHLIP